MIKDEFIDEDLQNVGVRFIDETKNAEQMPKVERSAPVTNEKPVPTKEKATDARWEPAPYHAPSWYDRLKGCVKWVTICGGISSLLLFFQIKGLMAAEAAVPCIYVCMMLGGYGVGKHTAEGRKGHEKEVGR